MSSNPTQEQVAFAYGQYLKAHNGDTALAMADLQVFIAGYSDPVADTTHPEMVLDAPAMVSHTIFAAGMPWYAVVQMAKELYAQNGDPQPSQVRIDEFRAWIEQGMPAQQIVSP